MMNGMYVSFSPVAARTRRASSARIRAMRVKSTSKNELTCAEVCRDSDHVLADQRAHLRHRLDDVARPRLGERAVDPTRDRRVPPRDRRAPAPAPSRPTRGIRRGPSSSRGRRCRCPADRADLDAVLRRHPPNERRRLRAKALLERVAVAVRRGAAAGAAMGRGRSRRGRRRGAAGGRAGAAAARGDGGRLRSRRRRGRRRGNRRRSRPFRAGRRRVCTGTVWPSLTRISASTPLDRRRDLGVDLVRRDLEDRLVALDRSPTFFSHFDSVPSAIDSPIWGITTSTRATASSSLRVLRASPPARNNQIVTVGSSTTPDERSEQPIRHPVARRARFGIGRAPRSARRRSWPSERRPCRRRRSRRRP